MQSCCHAPKCNNEVDKKTDKLVICQGQLHNEIKTFEGLRPCLFYFKEAIAACTIQAILVLSISALESLESRW